MDDLIARINIEIERDIELVNGEDEQAHNQRHWPDRIERQAAAFRKILDIHSGPHSCGFSDYDDADPCGTQLALAEVYGIDTPPTR